MVKEQVSLEDMIIFGQVFYTKVLLFDLGEASCAVLVEQPWKGLDGT